jgi:hypothetical protein
LVFFTSSCFSLVFPTPPLSFSYLAIVLIIHPPLY